MAIDVGVMHQKMYVYIYFFVVEQSLYVAAVTFQTRSVARTVAKLQGTEETTDELSGAVFPFLSWITSKEMQ